MLAFVNLVIGNLGMIFSNRSRTRPIFSTLRVPNPALWWVSGGTVTFLALVLAIPFLRDLFHFAALHSGSWRSSSQQA
jgi:Ca2+-transporting ATPase